MEKSLQSYSDHTSPTHLFSSIMNSHHWRYHHHHESLAPSGAFWNTYKGNLGRYWSAHFQFSLSPMSQCYDNRCSESQLRATHATHTNKLTNSAEKVPRNTWKWTLVGSNTLQNVWMLQCSCSKNPTNRRNSHHMTECTHVLKRPSYH